MPENKSTGTRDRILESSGELFRRQGYAGTGIKAILTASDAPYGSLSRLGGLGPKGNVGFASGISHGGHFAGGYTTVNNQSVGIYWTLP